MNLQFIRQLHCLLQLIQTRYILKTYTSADIPNASISSCLILLKADKSQKKTLDTKDLNKPCWTHNWEQSNLIPFQRVCGGDEEQLAAGSSDDSYHSLVSTNLLCG